MRIVMLICITLIAIGCNKQEIDKEMKGDFQIDTLFVKDGCAVYRF